MKKQEATSLCDEDDVSTEAYIRMLEQMQPVAANG